MTMWVINTEEPVESPFTFRILPGAIKTIGRAPRADFIVDAALVSRVHCRLSAGAAELEVVDLESTNGTFVNGARVERAAAQDGRPAWRRQGRVRRIPIVNCRRGRTNSPFRAFAPALVQGLTARAESPSD